MAEDAALWEVLEEQMNALLPAALGVIGDVFARQRLAYYVTDIGSRKVVVNVAKPRETVSYTHLDVYKRQGLSRIAARACGPGRSTL